MPQRPTSGASLADGWSRHGSLPLNGLLERNAFPPLLMALLVPLITFILVQIIVIPVVLIPLLMTAGGEGADAASLTQNLMQEHTSLLMVANSVGQVLGLALPAVLISRLHTTRPWSFLRVRPLDLHLAGLGLLGWVGLYPVVSWLGKLNEQLPMPGPLQEFDMQQMELIEQVLTSDLGITFNLIVLAIVPALCEEVLFRGYVQRQAERGLGGAGGIALSGIFFGFYHLRFSQVLPLCILGLYLAYVAWRTGSVWMAVLVHLANNAFAVFAGAYVSSRPELNVENVEQMYVPWYLVLGGLLLLGVVVAAMHKLAPAVRQQVQSASSGRPS